MLLTREGMTDLWRSEPSLRPTVYCDVEGEGALGVTGTSSPLETSADGSSSEVSVLGGGTKSVFFLRFRSPRGFENRSDRRSRHRRRVWDLQLCLAARSL